MTRRVKAPSVSEDDADHLRDLERTRVRSLVASDMETALPLHAVDFQLITPNGRALSREEYLGAIAAGNLKYLLWKPDAMDVRMKEGVALIRYQAKLDVVSRGHHGPSFRCWHTDSYEMLDGRWQVVWSQATEIR